jgi:hypothetical protein
MVEIFAVEIDEPEKTVKPVLHGAGPPIDFEDVARLKVESR